MSDEILAALQECERTYLLMIQIGTPVHIRAHKQARARFQKLMESRP